MCSQYLNHIQAGILYDVVCNSFTMLIHYTTLFVIHSLCWYIIRRCV